MNTLQINKFKLQSISKIADKTIEIFKTLEGVLLKEKISKKKERVMASWPDKHEARA